MRAEVGHSWCAGSQQSTHQVRPVPAEYEYVVLVLDRAEDFEQRGPRFGRVQQQTERRATRRGRCPKMRQHTGCPWRVADYGPDWSFMRL